MREAELITLHCLSDLTSLSILECSGPLDNFFLKINMEWPKSC